MGKFVLSLLVAGCIVGLSRAFARTNRDVYGDLCDAESGDDRSLEAGEAGGEHDHVPRRDVANGAPGAVSFLNHRERNRWRIRKRFFPPAGAAVAVLASAPWTLAHPSGVVAAAVAGASTGFLAVRHFEKKATRRFLREIEFHLPLVMERLVIAVQAGLDLLSALQRVVEIDRTVGSRERSSEPVTRLLNRVFDMSQEGIPFEQALEEVAREVPSRPVRHCFLHLAMAFREGGELVAPLRELSDATQQQYQDSVEEDIAKMPVRMTLPLITTFAGVIILFVTAPIMQILSITESALPK